MIKIVSVFSFGNGPLDVCAKHMINLQHFLLQWATACMFKILDQFATFPLAMGHCMYVQNTSSIAIFLVEAKDMFP
jgi:hypothetical protein